MNEFKVIRGQIGLEDIEVGYSSKEVKRNGTKYTLTQLNASGLLGILVVATYEDLIALDQRLLVSKSVYVQERQAVYTWDVNTQQWITDNTNLKVVDRYEDLNTLTGHKLAFNMLDKIFYYYDGAAWQANDTTLYVVDATTELDTLATGISMVIIKETGQLYYRAQGGVWQAIVFDAEGDPVIVVDTLANLPISPAVKTAIVSDAMRGGVFHYDQTKADINDNGIIINGWVRQYSGLVDAKWYGAVGDGITDDTSALISAFKNAKVLLPEGTYLCNNTVSIDSDTHITANGATIKLVTNGSLKCSGTLASTSTTIGAISEGAISIAIDNRAYEINDVLQIVDVEQSFGKHSKSSSQISVIRSKDGTLSVGLYGALEHKFVNATARKVNTIKVVIDGLTIINEGQQTALALEYNNGSVINNCAISGSNTPVSLLGCLNTKVYDSILNTSGSGSIYALAITDSDSTIVEASRLYGVSYAVKLLSVAGICNDLRISNCKITAQTVVDCGGNINKLRLENNTISGRMLIGGRHFTLDGSTIYTDAFAIKFDQLVGGRIVLNNSNFIGSATSVQHMFVTHSDSNTLVTNTSKISESVDYVVTNCNFNDTTGQYLGAVEAIGIPATSTASAIPSSLNVKNLQMQGILTNAIQLLRLGGTFSVVSILGTKSTIPICSAKEMYTRNTSFFSSFLTKYLNTTSFYSDTVYTVNGVYGSQVSDGTTVMGNQGYRIIAEGSTLVIKEATIQGKDLAIVQKEDDVALTGMVISKSVDLKACLELKGTYSSIPTNQSVATIYVRMSGPIMLTDTKLTNGVV